MPEFSSFKLVVTPLQIGVVGSYLVRGTWFTSRLAGGNRVISRFVWATTAGLQYPGYRTRQLAISHSTFKCCSQDEGDGLW
jgi:hypothetical protein